MFNFTYIAIAVYFIILLIVGFLIWRKESLSDFLIADRKLNPLQAGGSWIATWFDGPLLFVTITIAFSSLGGLVWFYAGIVLGLLVYIAYGPKLRTLAAESEAFTYPTLVYERIGFSSGLVITIIAIISWFGLAALQFIAGAQILEQLSGIQYEYGIVLMGVVVCAYMTLGGFKASVITDVIQISFLLLVCGILLFTGQRAELGDINILTEFKQEFGSYIWSTFLVIFAVMFAADGIPRMFASSSPQNAKNSVWVAIFGFMILGTFFGYFGLTASQINPSLNPDDVPIWVFTEYLPDMFFPLALVALFGLIMSSADTYILVTAQSVTTDFLRKFNILNEKRPRFNVRCGIIGTTLAAMTLALLYDDIIDFFFYIMMFVGIGAPALLALMHNMNKNPHALAISCGLALIAHIALLASGQLTEQNSVMINIFNTVFWFTLEKVNFQIKLLRK